MYSRTIVVSKKGKRSKNPKIKFRRLKLSGMTINGELKRGILLCNHFSEYLLDFGIGQHLILQRAGLIFTAE